MRVLYRSYISNELVLIPPICAFFVCCVVAAFGTINWWIASGWIFLIGIFDQLLKWIDRRFNSRHRDDKDLQKWGLARTGLSTMHGLAWSLGSVLLHVPGEPSSTIGPMWGLAILAAMSVYSTSAYPVTMVAVITAAMVPAAIWLFFQGGEIETLSATCVLIAWAVILLLGLAAARNATKFIVSRLDIADLLEQQKQQNKIIQQAHAERTRFFSAASHDLRQPLHALGFYVTLLNSVASDDERRQILNRLSECAISLDRQFNAILGVADTDTAVEQATAKPTSLQTLFERVIVSIRPEADWKKLRLRIVPTRLVANVPADLLERVLVNLLANSVRYTQTGGVLIGASRIERGAKIWVADTGIGIDSKDQQAIFEDFVQLHNPERNRDKGFGLGLAIVRRLCQGLNWTIELKSEPGRGSIFSITVPLASGEQVSEAKAQPTREDMPALTERNILFVDDDYLVRDAMGRLLSGWGLAPQICRTGDEALSILSAKSNGDQWYVLLDHRLAEGETGLDLADRISSTHGDTVKIYLVTGETDDHVLEEAQRRGIGVMRKPLKPIRLRAALSAPFDVRMPARPPPIEMM